MASLLLKGVHKRLGLPTISISCTSADATNIIASTGTGAVVGSSGRAIDRHSPRLRDPHRSSASKPPRPSTSSTTKDSASSDDPKQQQQHGHGSKKKKKSTTAAAAGISGSRSSEKRLEAPPSTGHQAESSSSGTSSSASSSSEITAVQEEEQHKPAALARSSSTTAAARTTQVVVLRVSLHCKGCAGKVKKHLAKMEGVTSFDIDIPSKKVTVVGDVTPLGVLTSVSKVKPAQFWPSTPCPPRASASF
ncbi:unnamed protein product [Triticum turgidum subsp. durum]|uniref:HMA domain-containing protein n=1 Tax=Triticum turgidum subsp. durum TaxID=4567 RepID=A0A9R1QZK0_TRITD|nr:unnamed protein product [Triticum turgidum subsp. durum]